MLYLIIIVPGISGEVFVRNRLKVPGDATITAANIRSMESLWRFGIAAELFLLICAVGLTLIFFVLLRPVFGLSLILFGCVNTLERVSRASTEIWDPGLVSGPTFRIAECCRSIPAI